MTDSTQLPGNTQTDPTTTADGTAADGAELIVMLHVEPDPESAELLSTFASRLTNRVQVRSVGRLGDALNAVESGVVVNGETVSIDCVVTEQRLLMGTGVELVKRLRATGRDLPVVFYTTCPADEAEAQAFDAGADAYFEKRSDPDRCGRILGRAQALVEGDGDRNRQSD